jgi:hypothetical protein
MKPTHKLPLLDLANNAYPDVDLSEVTVLGCQHFFVSNYLMFEKLFERGLRPEKTFVIPKSYTHNPTVEKLLRDRGVMVWQYEYDSHEPFDKRMRDECAAFVEFLKKERRCEGKILILDDGGDLAYVSNSLLSDRECYGVEQTSSGFNKLTTLELRYPVVNMARSDTKLHVESLFIGERMVFKTLTFLNDHGIDPQRCLVIGHGPIGAQVFRDLSRYYPTDVFDIDQDRTGVTGDLAEMIGNYDLIFGCAGKLSVPATLHDRIKPGAVMVCASLREFEPHILRRKVPKCRDPHEHLQIEGRWLVNSGFPVNFDGALNDVVPEKIQVTQSLMLVSAYQALGEVKPGIIPLDEKLQDRIVSEFKEYISTHYFKLYDRDAR